MNFTKFIHKIHIAGQKARMNKIGINAQDPTQLEVITPTYIETNRFQIIKIDTTPMINQETLQISIKESTQITLVRIIQIRNFNSIPITEHIIHLVITDLEITPDLQIIAIKIDQEFILSHHIENLTRQKQHTFKQNHNYGSSTPKHQRQINQVQTTNKTKSDPPGIDNTKTLEMQLGDMQCEKTDDESDTESTSIINMLKIEQEYEVPIDLIFYQNEKSDQNLTDLKLIKETNWIKPSSCRKSNKNEYQFSKYKIKGISA